MPGRISFNVNYAKIDGTQGQQRMLRFVGLYRPTTFLIMNGQEFIGRVNDAAQGQTLVIHRRFYSENGGEDGAWGRISAKKYIQDVTFNYSLPKYTVIYVLNEPNAADDRLPVLCDWLVDCMYELQEKGYRGVIGNLGPASFEPYRLGRGYFDRYLTELGRFSDAGWMYGGWHEYTAILLPYGVGRWSQETMKSPELVSPDKWALDVFIERVPPYPMSAGETTAKFLENGQMVEKRASTYPQYWHLLRSGWWDLRAREIGANIHKKIITECFWDDMPNERVVPNNIYKYWEERVGSNGYMNIRGQNTLAPTWKELFPNKSFNQAMYDQLMWALKVYPDEKSDMGKYIGFNMFTVSKGTEWDVRYGFNFGDNTEFIDKLINERADEPDPVTNIYFNKPPMELPVSNLPDRSNVNLVLGTLTLDGAAGVNVRNSNTDMSASTVVYTLRQPTIRGRAGKVNPADAWWVVLFNAPDTNQEVYGWMSDQFVNFVADPTTPDPEPDPEPSIDPGLPSWVLSNDEIQNLINLYTEIGKLHNVLAEQHERLKEKYDEVSKIYAQLFDRRI